MDSPSAVIPASRLNLTFQTNDGLVHALSDVNLEVARGDFVSFIGPAGCGKAICFVTHSTPEAVYLSTRIVVTSPRPGRIVDVIESPLPAERPLDICESPAFPEVAHRVRGGLRAGHSYDD